MTFRYDLYYRGVQMMQTLPDVSRRTCSQGQSVAGEEINGGESESCVGIFSSGGAGLSNHKFLSIQRSQP